MRRLDIGVASYGANDRLRRTLASIYSRSRTDWRCIIVDNPGPDPKTREVIAKFCADDGRFRSVLLDENRGYAGAVNEILRQAETEYVAYCDNDVQIHTDGWDEKLCAVLDRHHEVGIVFPNGRNAIAPIPRAGYREVMWGIGFCWVVSRLAFSDVGDMDESLGHQEEADWCLRMRMAGFRCAALESVNVAHNATATKSAASTERISRGVVNFVDKWVKYFCGKRYDYHHPNVLRWEDWPPNALYLEEYYRQFVPQLNAEPERAKINGTEYDLLKVPRFKDFYRGRII